MLILSALACLAAFSAAIVLHRRHRAALLRIDAAIRADIDRHFADAIQHARGFGGPWE